jgi:hypothetical protein
MRADRRRDVGHDIGELPDDAELLVSAERAYRREDLGQNVAAVTVDVGQGVAQEVVDERGSVRREERDRSDPVSAQRTPSRRDLLLCAPHSATPKVRGSTATGRR